MLTQRRLHEFTVPFTHREAVGPWYLSLPSFEGRVWQVRDSRRMVSKGKPLTKGRKVGCRRVSILPQMRKGL